MNIYFHIIPKVKGINCVVLIRNLAHYIL